jgi:hypothetical protein
MLNYGVFTKDARFFRERSWKGACFELDLLPTGLRRPYNRVVVYRQAYSVFFEQPEKPFVVVPGFYRGKPKKEDVNSVIADRWEQYSVIKIDEESGQKLGMSAEELDQWLDKVLRQDPRYAEGEIKKNTTLV